MDESSRFEEVDIILNMKIRLLLLVILIYSCSESKPIEQANSSSPEDLVNHSLEFKEIIEVTEGVHVAVGFALANAIMIEEKFQYYY